MPLPPRKNRKTTQFVNHLDANVEVNISNWFLSGSSFMRFKEDGTLVASTVVGAGAAVSAEASRGHGFISASQMSNSAADNTFKIFFERAYPQPFPVNIDLQMFTTSSLSSVGQNGQFQLKVLSWQLQGSEPHIRVGLLSSSAGVNGMVPSGTFVQPGFNFATCSLRVEVPSSAGPRKRS